MARSSQKAAVAGSTKNAETLDREVSQARRKEAAAPAPTAAQVPLFQVRCAMSALKAFERSGSGTALFTTYKAIYPKRFSDTPTMAFELAFLVEQNADRLN